MSNESIAAAEAAAPTKKLVVPQLGLPAGLVAAEVQSTLLNFGFTLEEIASVLEKYDPSVVTLLAEGLRAGFGKIAVLAMLQKIGTPGVRFLLDLINQNHMFSIAKAAGLEVQLKADAKSGREVAGLLDEPLIQLILEKYLPLIVGAYGPELLDLLKNAFNQWFAMRRQKAQ